jgi:hypothetical protein
MGGWTLKIPSLWNMLQLVRKALSTVMDLFAAMPLCRRTPNRLVTESVGDSPVSNSDPGTTIAELVGCNIQISIWPERETV